MRRRICALALCAAVLLSLTAATAWAAEETTGWDGTTIDVSWYNTTDTEFYLSTPEQLMGLAAIVNGIYNQEITTIIGDPSCIVDNMAANEDSGLNGNNKSSDVYHYGADDFSGKTIYLTADLDMGGYASASGVWRGPRYMPIGGQYLMERDDAATRVDASFCGTLDGQGHTISNIYCDRYCSDNYGDGSSVGLVGRLGVHDNDPEESRPSQPAVRNLAVTGYIRANRSVGGVVGKIGKTADGAVIENCANFATVRSTDAKGCGGIVGAGWNGGVIRNCYNAGTVSSSYISPTGGISGSNEIAIENCYNIGTISAAVDSYAMAIGTNNGGGTDVDNCYWLSGSAPGGGYYGVADGTVTELTAEEMQAADFPALLGDAFTADLWGVNGGYPVLTWQAEAAQQRFSDVASDAWYRDAVYYVVEQGYFAGTGDATFEPEGSMTRAMFVTVMSNVAGADVSGYTETRFWDVSPDDWYALRVNWAAANGIVAGTGDGAFSPNSDITLEQMIAVLYSYAGGPAAGGSLPDDVGPISGWAEDAMRWAEETGLLDGMGGTLSAQGSATRAQVARILLNFDQR